MGFDRLRQGVEIVAAFQKRNHASPAVLSRKIKQAAAHPFVGTALQIDAGQRVPAVRVEAGRNQKRARLKFLQRRQDLFFEGAAIVRVAGAPGHGNIEGRAESRTDAAVFFRSGAGIKRILVRADEKYIRIVVKHRFGAVAVVHVPVHDGDFLQIFAALLLQIARGDGHVVKQTKTHRAIVQAVVTRGAQEQERSLDFAGENSVGRGEARAGRQSRRFVRLRADDRVAVEITAALFRAHAIHGLHVGRIVAQTDLFDGGRTAFQLREIGIVAGRLEAFADRHQAQMSFGVSAARIVLEKDVVGKKSCAAAHTGNLLYPVWKRRAIMKADNDSAGNSGMAIDGWISAVREELAGLRDNDRYRTLKAHTGRLDFSSNDYLSLNASGLLDEFLRRLLTEPSSGAGDDSFVGSTGSRLIRGHYEAFAAAEADFARYVGAPSALLFHSGYAANTGALPAVVAPRDLVFCDRLCHASLLDGIRLSGARRYYFRHNDLNDLEAQLAKYASTGAKRIWLVTEAVFSMDGDSPDLRALCRLADRYDACVYLDEAHSIGVTGDSGAGLAAREGVAQRIAVNVFPCGKAPGLMGAFVCGAPELKELLVNRARSLIFSTAQPPHLARLLSLVIEWLQTEDARRARDRVRKLAEDLRRELQALGFNTGTSTTHIVPVIVGDEAKALALAQACQDAGLDVRAIRPPTVPKNTSRLRVILQAGHSDADLNDLIAVLRAAMPTGS